MSLPIQHIHLNEVAEVLRYVATRGEGPWIAGQCFVLDYDAVTEEAEQIHLPWHVRLLRRAIIGLWDQKPRRSACVFYACNQGLIFLVYASRSKAYPTGLAKAFGGGRWYRESGRDYLPINAVRPLAYWEPPCMAVGLWPSGPNGEMTDGRVVDTGSLLGWFSYPEAYHNASISVEKSGPDYVRVPSQELECFNQAGAVYHYQNRWAKCGLGSGAEHK